MPLACANDPECEFDNLPKSGFEMTLRNRFGNTVELQWLDYLWDHENKFETGVVRANECNHSARSGGIIGIYFRFPLTCRYSLCSH